MEKDKNAPVQQSDYLKAFMLTILNEGLDKAYELYEDCPPGPSPPTSLKMKSQVTSYDVIVVGAGIAGLAAAYEMKRVGLTVKILEQTERYGGRIFTYTADSTGKKLAEGLYFEAGAMRLPGKVEDLSERPHFLTEGYIDKFNLDTKAFPNYDENGISNIYGLRAKTSEWAGLHFDKVWPHWKLGIKNDMWNEIQNIDEYYEKTTGVVTDQLKTWLTNANGDIEKEICEWDRWIDIWSQFTLESFLESNIGVIRAKFSDLERQDLDEETLGNLLPWSNDAVRGYSVSTYTEQLDQSLVQYLRDQLGQWWSENMHTLVGGMHSLPEAFFGSDKLDAAEDIAFKKQVSKITYSSVPSQPNDDFVKVTCYPNDTESESTYTARAVIVTTPVNVLRLITFSPLLDTEEVHTALRKNLQAIEDIYTGPATKVILQTKTRFWEDDNIQGGFSKTNLPIGQIHYVKPDPDYVNTTNQGIILNYTWKNEALLFGSLTEDQVRQEIIEQVAEIHPGFNDEMVEICIVHAWYNQPSYQGAYGLMKTTQFNNIRQLWDPMGNIHFSGENLSFVPGWIQGALESGLRSAYQVYARHVKRTTLLAK